MISRNRSNTPIVCEGADYNSRNAMTAKSHSFEEESSSLGLFPVGDPSTQAASSSSSLRCLFRYVGECDKIPGMLPLSTDRGDGRSRFLVLRSSCGREVGDRQSSGLGLFPVGNPSTWATLSSSSSRCLFRCEGEWDKMVVRSPEMSPFSTDRGDGGS